jgi:flavin-dependent dehydrogenase
MGAGGQMTQALNRVVILGGGTAGWLTAATLAAEHGASLDITLVESPDIPIIGVGEGTWPSMRSTLQKIGISEKALLTECDATFKQGTEFIGWLSDREPHTYYHPFSLPADYASLNLAEHWLASNVTSDFCSSVTPQAGVISAGRAPKALGVPEFAFQFNYGYHFDAAKLSELLRDHAVGALGIKHLFANLTGVERADSGAISALALDNGTALAGDFFVDCSGQRGLLIGEAMGVPMRSMSHVLPNDRAVATQVPYSDPNAQIASVTRSTAQASGWMWDIGLQSRRGVGYVHSAAHISEDEAVSTVLDYVKHSDNGVDVGQLNVRVIPFEASRRTQAWVKNCVAVGLSGGFIEPLEASSIALIEQASNRLCQMLPLDADNCEAEARAFNEQMNRQWSQVEEFLQLHYVLSQRSDSAYWRDVRSEDCVLPELSEKLEKWRRHPVWHADAPRFDELFPSASYQYVLYGMLGRYFSPQTHRRSFHSVRDRADSAMHEVRERAAAARSLPGNRELLSALLGQPSGTLEGVA